MKLIDISWTISTKMTTYKNKQSKKPGIKQTRSLERGAVEHRVRLDSHCGTHVDAPAHMLRGKTIDQISLEKLCGPCKVFEIKTEGKIDKSQVERLDIKKGDIVLFKTPNSQSSETAKFKPEFTYLGEDAANYLSKKKVKSVGIDYLGIERSQKGHPTHKTLLKSGIPIIEGLRLRGAKPGKYKLFCLPLKIKAGDAAPARAILIRE
ncbi:cyclase family protein [Candidatus Woesearchaeota archaeon]|nr:MAG: cyclase family protein [Candidatus Woesearchaeota archaeon]